MKGTLKQFLKVWKNIRIGYNKKINHKKPSIFITRNTNLTTKAAINQIMPYKSSSSKMKYLDLPTSFSRAKKQELLMRINKKLEGWKYKLL